MRNIDPFEELIRSLEENLRTTGQRPGGPQPGGPPPSGDDSEREVPAPRWGRWLYLIIPIVLFYLAARSIGLIADYTWITSVGYQSVFWTRIGVMFGLFIGAAILFMLFYSANVILARQLAPWGIAESPLQQILSAFGLRVMPVVMLAGVAMALILGTMAVGHWESVLLYLHNVPFGKQDPLFGRDIGTFVFALPVWNALRGWLTMALLATAAAVAVVVGAYRRGWSHNRGAVIHLAILIALMLLLVAWQFHLSAFNLAYSQRGVIYGAGFADVHATLPALRIMVWLSVIISVVIVVVALLRRSLGAVLILGGVWLVAAFVLLSVYPSVVERFRVRPNELTLETPYIQDAIDSTRSAYALDAVKVESYDASQSLSPQDLIGQPGTLLNVRLWDYRPLLQTYNQVQALRQYYEFNDIDIDRYTVDGRKTQVMLGARELIPERLSEDAQTWVNRRLVYTHGYGVAASPVSKVTTDGLPTFLVKDLPPTGVISVTVPQIYFGERTGDYVVGNTARPEFDFPREDGNVFTHFSADTGIPMTWWNRVLFALHFADISLILNGDISSESRLLWQRDIAARAQKIAPFLVFDSDPYIVVGEDGHLYWIHDAYTTTDRYPYSEPLSGLNYIRNAVKVVTDAYDGTVNFYIADPDDPIIQSYARAFPKLFLPLSEIPAGLINHVRYPQDLFAQQAEIYRTYHMTDPTEFYNREDLWAWPEEVFDNSPTPVEPNYVLMQLPGQSDLDYVMILPYTPASRENMVSWLAVRSDPNGYGEKLNYRFGKDSLLFGPKQVEARIDQDPAISAQLTLWNQQGSGVIRGTVLVFPFGNSLLYVEPLYLQAQSGRIPELKRVILATSDSVEMGTDLSDALTRMFGTSVSRDATVQELAAEGTSGEQAAAEGADVEAGAALTLDDLILKANEVFAEAQARQREGDWAGYGERIAELSGLLAQLAKMNGVALPVATPDTGGGLPATPTAHP